MKDKGSGELEAYQKVHGYLTDCAVHFAYHANTII